jgi:hypothetical protein
LTYSDQLSTISVMSLFVIIKSFLKLRKGAGMDIQTAKQIFDAHDGIVKSKEIIESKYITDS